MPLTVNVGYSQKLGRPDFGSIGASCHMECELDVALAFGDPETLQTKLGELYSACSQAVEAELSRHHSGGPRTSSNSANGSRKNPQESQSARASESALATNGAAQPRASRRQLDYLEQLARQIEGLGARRLESLAQRICGKPLADSSSFDASRLIDTLKAMKEGRLDLEAALNGSRG